MKPVLLILVPMAEHFLDQLRERFELICAPTAAARRAAVAAHGRRIEAVLTNGTTGLAAAEIDAMPKLGFASALGAGYENLAVDHARQRGVALANGAGTNDDCVADHALALLLATVRAIPKLDAATRAGVWREALPMQPQFAGKRLGLLGLGLIGAKIARRGMAFDLAIGYHNRSPQPAAAASYRYFDALPALAAWCDFLVVAVPGGDATHHLVDRAVLGALGPGGYLVNIARGSVVDTAALVDALAAGEIAGAGLDVYEGEPAPPATLLGFDNVVLTPHVAGRSPESIQASVDCFVDNAERHFAARPLRTPI